MSETDDRGALQGLLEASMLELPLALQKWMLGTGKKGGREVEEAVLKACQAWTNFANENVEKVYQAQGFMNLMTASMKNLVQCQRMLRDFIETMVPGPGFSKPSASSAEIEEMREGLNKLRREVRQLTARVNLLDRRDEARNGLN